MDHCPYCQSGHAFTQCNRILTVSLAERVEVANKLRLCFHCCTTGHGAKNCPEKKNVICSTCNRKGHIAVFHGRQQLPPNTSSEAPRRTQKHNVGFETTIVDPKTNAADAAAASAGAAAAGTTTPEGNNVETPTI